MDKAQLSQVCEVKKGQTITKKTITEGAIPVVAGGQQPAYYHNKPNRTGDVITVSGSGAYAGFVNFFTEPVFASDCITIQSLDETKVLTRYVFYLLKGQQKYLYSMQRGAGQPHVYPKDLVSIEIPLPPLPIQKQIVAILEKAESLKQKRNETNKETQKIIQSIFYEMFGDPVKNERGWDEDKFENVCKKLFAGGDVPKDNFSKEETDEYKIPVYSNGTGDKAFYGYTNIEKVQEDSVTISARGTIGYPIIRKAPFYPIIRLVVATPNINKVNLEYFKEAISFFRFDKGGTSIPQLTVPMIKNNKMLVPPLPLQEEFAKKVQLIESIQSKQQSSTNEINRLFDVLMQKAFKGELVE